MVFVVGANLWFSLLENSVGDPPGKGIPMERPEKNGTNLDLGSGVCVCVGGSFVL